MMTKMLYTTFKQFKVGPESKHAYQSDLMTHLFNIVNRQTTMTKIPLADGSDKTDFFTYQE